MTPPVKAGTSKRQLVCARLWSACVVAYVENGFGGVMLSVVRIFSFFDFF